jgi:non-canonical poly(A) RNA polymerase PAPD5/7
MSETVPQPRQKSRAPRSHRRKRAKEQEDERGEVKETAVQHNYDRTPKEPRSKRARTNGKGKEKESELELGELPNDSSRSFEIGDEFIPFAVSDNEAEAPKTQDSRRSNVEITQEKTREREWDKGKLDTHGDGSRHGGGRGTKRTYEMVFDDEDLRDHRKRRQDFHHTSRKAPWIAEVDWDGCRNVAEMLHREVEAFVRYMSPTEVEEEIRGLVITLVSNAITNAFPDARILPFGSYETKLYLPNGDIDLVIKSDSMAYSDKVNVLRTLANIIKRARIASKVTIIAKAKVPIIKFVTVYGRLNVDISINQGNGVVAGDIVNGFLNGMRGCGFALRSLVIIAKAFLNQRGMNEVYTGGLGSYSIVCLAVSFLQMHPKIRRGEIDAEKNLGVLVMEFFELYGCYFNYEEVGISVRNGGSYFSKRQRGWYDFTKKNLLSIEDPTDSSNDISKGSYGIAKVRQTLAGAHGIMTSMAFLRAGILGARREGRTYPLRGHGEPEDMSILSSILGVTQETLNNRLLIQEVYDQRLLHKLLGTSPKPRIVVANVLETAAQDKSSMAASSITRTRERSVDMLLETDDESLPQQPSGSRQDNDELSRYHIEKRRVVQRHEASRSDEQPEFTTDEDDSVDEEEASYQMGLDDGASVNETRSMTSKRRSFWLSKGIGPESADDSN